MLVNEYGSRWNSQSKLMNMNEGRKEDMLVNEYG